MQIQQCVASDLCVAVIGASLGGLSAANVLRQLGAEVHVFDAFGKGFEERGGALGAVDVNLLQAIRYEPNPGSASYKQFRGHGHFYGDLWKFLYAGLNPEHVHFGYDLLDIVDMDSRPRLVFGGKETQDWQFDLVVGADGGKSTVRPFVTPERPTYSGYTLYRGLCPVDAAPGPPSGSKQVDGVRYETLGFTVQVPRGLMWNCGVYMAMPERDVEAPVRNRQIGATPMTVPDWFVPFVRAAFGEENEAFWDNCAKAGKVTPHAVWELACDQVVKGRVLLLGDAAHMASPRTGAGAYTAMSDAWSLGRAMSSATSIQDALDDYNHDTVARGKALFARSRQAASYFAPPRKAPHAHPKDVLAKLSH